MPRPGRTLIELLVVVAVVAVLLGLVLAAVQKVRQRAARLRDENAIRQLGVAAHGFSTQHGKLPPFSAPRPGDKESDPYYVPALAWLMPHLEEPSLDELYRLQPREGCSPGYRLCFDHVAKPYVSTLDPSHTDGRVDFVWRPGVHDRSGAANYAVNVRLVGNPSNTCGVNDRRTNLLTGIPDGTSNTLLTATRRAKCGDGGSVWGGTHLPGYCGTEVVGGYFGHAFPESEAFQVTPSDAACDPNRPQAFTSAGLSVGMADGGVRLVRLGVEAAVWRAGVMPNDGKGLPE